MREAVVYLDRKDFRWALSGPGFWLELATVDGYVVDQVLALEKDYQGFLTGSWLVASVEPIGQYVLDGCGRVGRASSTGGLAVEAEARGWMIPRRSRFNRWPASSSSSGSTRRSRRPDRGPSPERGARAGLAALEGQALVDCPYPDRRGSNGRITFARTFRKYWADGFQSVTLFPGQGKRRNDRWLIGRSTRRGASLPFLWP